MIQLLLKGWSVNGSLTWEPLFLKNKAFSSGFAFPSYKHYFTSNHFPTLISLML